MKVDDLTTSDVPEREKKPNKKAGGGFLSANGPSHYNDQLIDIGILQRVMRSEAAWRRAFIMAMCFALLVTAGWLSESLKSHTEAIVYKEDTSGDLALIGMTSKNSDPSEPSIVNALRVYMSARRAIPAGNGITNLDVINLNAKQVKIMTDHDSPADVAYTENLHEENPIELSKKGYARTVIDVEVDKLADLRYRVSWHETLRNGINAESKTSAYTGEIQLAAPPKVPNDYRIGQLNPVGIYVADTNLRASILH